MNTLNLDVIIRQLYSLKNYKDFYYFMLKLITSTNIFYKNCSVLYGKKNFVFSYLRPVVFYPQHLLTFLLYFLKEI